MIMNREGFELFSKSGYTAKEFSDGVRQIMERFREMDFSTIRAITDKSHEVFEIPVHITNDDGVKTLLTKGHVQLDPKDQTPKIHFVVDEKVAGLLGYKIQLTEFTSIEGDRVEAVLVPITFEEFRIKGL